MASYTTGQIRRLHYIPEVTWAATPVAALKYSGEIARLKPSNNMNVELIYLQGSRAFGMSTRGAFDVGFNYSAQVRKNSTSPAWNWVDFWYYYAAGVTSGVPSETTLPSFTALIGKTVGANNYYNIYNGCKVNQLTIEAEKPGEALSFSVDVVAQMIDYDTDKTFTRFQTVDLSAQSDPTPPTTDPITWRGTTTTPCMKINVAGGGLVNIYPAKWTFQINNNMQREYGLVNGSDNVSYPVVTSLTEEKREIILELTLPHGNETFVNAKIAGSLITQVKIPVDDKVITLDNGVIMGEDFPELSQTALEESVSIRFPSVSVGAS